MLSYPSLYEVTFFSVYPPYVIVISYRTEHVRTRELIYWNGKWCRQNEFDKLIDLMEHVVWLELSWCSSDSDFKIETSSRSV